MNYLKITLIVVTGIGIFGFLVSWVQAYQKVENIEIRSQQISALQPWWFLDGKLLPKEHDYLRFRAAKYFVLYVVPLLVFWWLSGN